MYDSQAESVELLRGIERNTRDIADLLEVAYGNELRRRLTAVLTDGRRRLVYQGSDGDSSARQLAALAKVSDTTVRDWWKEWLRAGLMRPAQVEGRFVRKYDLERLSLGEEVEK